MDERFVAIERGPDLPALKERSFCVRLGVDGDTDIPALFAKARRMDPGRLVIGEMHAQEVREFFTFLAEDPRCGGLATLRAETVHRALDVMIAAFGGDQELRARRCSRASLRCSCTCTRTRRAGRGSRPSGTWRAATTASWCCSEVETAAPASSLLVAET